VAADRGSHGRLVRVLGSVVGAAALGILTASVALAYPAPAASGSLVSGCSSVNEGSSCVYTDQFLTASGGAVSGATATFVVGGVLGISVNPTSATTNSSGQASTTLSTATSACGTATITASVTGVTVTTSVTVPCSAVTTSLPATATAPPGPAAWLYAIFGIAAIVVVAGAVALRRTRQSVV
jgi:hypothetical protein